MGQGAEIVTYKQPREGVVGVDRNGDDFLSLDMRAVAHRAGLVAVAKHLRSACMVGDPAPVVREMSDRMRHPRVGDLVFEPTMATSSADLDTRTKALGYLVEKRTEWWLTDEDWAAEKAEDDRLTDEDRQTDEAWYVQYGPDPGDICRWTNCDFGMIPIDPMEFYRPIGSPTPYPRG
jgi:hypothetical protein